MTKKHLKELNEKLDELFENVRIDVECYTVDIDKQANNCTDIEDLKKMLEKVDELAGYLQAQVDDAENLVSEYENEGYRD